MEPRISPLGNKPEAVKLLINHGADPNLSPSSLGVSLLKFARQGNYIEVARILESHGAQEKKTKFISDDDYKVLFRSAPTGKYGVIKNCP